MDADNAYFLSNAPTTQFARLTDYGTLPFFNFLSSADYSFQTGSDTSTINKVHYFSIKLYNSSLMDTHGLHQEAETCKIIKSYLFNMDTYFSKVSASKIFMLFILYKIYKINIILYIKFLLIIFYKNIKL